MYATNHIEKFRGCSFHLCKAFLEAVSICILEGVASLFVFCGAGDHFGGITGVFLWLIFVVVFFFLNNKFPSLGVVFPIIFQYFYWTGSLFIPGLEDPGRQDWILVYDDNDGEIVFLRFWRGNQNGGFVLASWGIRHAMLFDELNMRVALLRNMSSLIA